MADATSIKVEYESFEIEQFSMSVNSCARILENIAHLISEIKQQQALLSEDVDKATNAAKKVKPINKEHIQMQLDLLQDCDEVKSKIAASVDKLHLEEREKARIDEAHDESECIHSGLRDGKKL